MTLQNVRVTQSAHMCACKCLCVWGEEIQKEDTSKAEKEVPERGKEHAAFWIVGN